MHIMVISAADRLGDIQEYYFSRKLEEIRRMNANGDDVINLGIGNPDMPPSPQVINALTSTAAEDGTHGYQSYKGIPELRKAISEYSLNTYNLHLDPEKEILPLLGSKEGISHVSMAFLNPGDEVLIPNPGYPTYASVTSLAGANPIQYNLNANSNWDIDWDHINQLDLKAVKLMWVNYPNMPTGARGSLPLFEKIVAFGREHNILICHDNPYSRILNGTPLSMLSVPESKDVVLELNSLSKSHNMAGWRMGWVSGNEGYISTILRYKSNIDSGMFLPVQKGGIAALEEGDAWFETLNDEYSERRAAVWNILDKLDCTYNKDQSGLFVWAKLGRSGSSSEEFCDNVLQESKVFITPGTIFGDNGEGYIRVSLCSTLQVFTDAADRIEKSNTK